MFNFEFGLIVVPFTDFHKQTHVNHTLTINLNKLVFSDKVSCNYGKNLRWIIGCQVDE